MINIDPSLPELMPKHQSLRKKFLREIRSGQWGEGYRLPPERELTDHFGVSITTVRRCLNDMVHEGLLVRHRRRGTFVTALAENRTRMVFGLLCDRMSITLRTPFFLRLLTSLEKQAVESGAGLRLLSSQEVENVSRPGQALLEMAHLHGLSGLFLASPFAEEWVHDLRESPDALPLLALQLDYTGIGVPSLLTDIKQPLEQAIRHLTDLGHKRITILFGKWEDAQGIPRAAAHRAARAVEEIMTAPRYRDCRTQFMTHPYFERHAVEKLAGSLLTRGRNRPTAFIIQEQGVAHLIREMAFDAGIRIPRDISIVTLEPVSPYSSFTAVVSQLDNLCWRAVRLMDQLSDGFTPRIIRERIGSDLVIRNSTAVPPEEAGHKNKV